MKKNSKNKKISLVWFKRDLRISDHEPLFESYNNSESLIPLYIFEPELWKEDDMSYRHFLYLKDAVEDLDNNLSKIGQKLIIKTGDALEIIRQLCQKYEIQDIYSHQESWNFWTFERDKKIKKFCEENKILWHEFQNNSVVRALKDRDLWVKKWNERIYKPEFQTPKKLKEIDEKSENIPSIKKLGVKKYYDDNYIKTQKITRQESIKTLKSFLYERGEFYQKEMSSPVFAFDSCSRMSIYIALGVISIKEIVKIVQERQKEIKGKKEYSNWSKSIRSFQSRLYWHCHFIQKLEDEPEIEFENFHKMYDNIRDYDEKRLQAYKDGKTGIPFIDTCMRALHKYGWINFRMRAMLVSFASIHLWLDWKDFAHHLSKLFNDYEPGIHFSQIQMQSGTTGINTIRAYNPIKQGMDHDKDGKFIKEFIPELRDLDDKFIHQPWLSQTKVENYPDRIVDESEARKLALSKIYKLRKTLEHKEEASKINKKHGSRKKRLPRTVKTKPKIQKKKKLEDKKQMELF